MKSQKWAWQNSEKNQHWLGKKHSQTTRDKLSIIKKGKPSKLKGRKLSEEFKKRLSESRKGMVFSEEHRKNLSISHKGIFRREKHPRWLGDKAKTLLVIRVRECFEYRQWRSDIFHRDRFTCVLCGAKSGNGKAVYLEADHFPKMFSEIWREYDIKTFEDAMNCAELWNINNGRTLCKPCHDKTKKGKPKNV